MTVSSTNASTATGSKGRTARRALTVFAAAGIIGAAVAACTPNEPPSDVPGTTPSVITGNQVPELPEVGEAYHNAETAAESASASMESTPESASESAAASTTESAPVSEPAQP